MFFPWFTTMMLAFESNDVIGLRLLKLAGGGRDAQEEACLMVSEKIDASFEAAGSLMAGNTPGSVIDRYREHVAANTRRLTMASLGRPVQSA